MWSGQARFNVALLELHWSSKASVFYVCYSSKRPFACAGTCTFAWIYAHACVFTCWQVSVICSSDSLWGRLALSSSFVFSAHSARTAVPCQAGRL